MSRTARRWAVLLVVLAVATGGASAFQAPAQVDIDADSVTLRAAVQEDGDADWTVTYRVRLEDGNATEAFEQLEADIESDPSPYLDPFRQRMERTAAGAENATGREMAIRNVTVETRRESQPQVEYGIVTYRLEWTNFAAVDGGTIRAGDAIDRLFLDPETSLRITAPEGYVVDSATPDPTRSDPSEVVWQGQRDFDRGEPRAVLVPEGDTPAGTATDGSGGDTGTPAGTDTPGGLPVTALVAAVVLLALGGAWAVSHGIPLPVGGGHEDAAGVRGGGDNEGGDGPPPELLSNEERVLRLLEENGGRMKQKEVAEQLDWTAAKTSQVVGDLRGNDELDSFRLGRENVLTLPDVDIEAGDDGTASDEE